jgi:hypothetical protein
VEEEVLVAAEAVGSDGHALGRSQMARMEY